MKQFLSLIAMVAMISSPAFAQTKKKTAAPAPTPASSTPTYSYSGGGSSSYSSGPAFSAAASLGSLDGTFLVGPSLYVEWPMTLDGKDFAFGGRTGIYFMSGGYVIPIMATGKYNFAASSNIKPYVGLDMGLAIAKSSDVTVTVLGVTTTVSGGSATKFALLARPGINFGEGGKWFAELPLGTFGAFVILPTFGYHF